MLGRVWIKSSVTLYVLCVVGYNFFGKATVGWTDFYYTFEKGMAFISTMWGLKEQTLSDRLFIDYARFLQFLTFCFFILCSFNDALWAYHKSAVVTFLVISSFGSVLVQYSLIKATKI